MDYSEKTLETNLSHPTDGAGARDSMHSSISDGHEKNEAGSPPDPEKVAVPIGTEETVVPLEKTETTGYASGLKLIVLSMSLCLAIFLVALDMTIVATAIPKVSPYHRI